SLHLSRRRRGRLPAGDSDGDRLRSKRGIVTLKSYGNPLRLHGGRDGPHRRALPGTDGADRGGLPMRLLISLHDVTPFHFAPLLKAEALFQEMGLQKLTYLFIPNYHGRFASAGHPE